MSVAALVTAVKARWKNDYLIQLTTGLSTETAINDTVLTAAAEDAIGAFERVTAITHDTANFSHLGILCQGVILFCEIYKARDVSILQDRRKDFFAACAAFRKSMYVSPATTSNLTIDREQAGTRPDMDTNRKVFKKPAQAGTIINTIESYG